MTKKSCLIFLNLNNYKDLVNDPDFKKLEETFKSFGVRFLYFLGNKNIDVKDVPIDFFKTLNKEKLTSILECIDHDNSEFMKVRIIEIMISQNQITTGHFEKYFLLLHSKNAKNSICDYFIEIEKG